MWKPELKSQSKVWKGRNSRWLQKFQLHASKVRQMMVMAYNYTGVIAPYMAPYGRTVDKHVYTYFFRKILRPTVWQMSSQMFDCVIILHDNTRPHITSVTTIFQEYGWEMLNYPPFSPDPCPPKLRPILKTQENAPGDLLQWLKSGVFVRGPRDLAAQQKPVLTWNRKAAGMLASVHFMWGGLHWKVIMLFFIKNKFLCFYE